MPINWENCKVKGLKHSNRWGHSSALMKNNELILFGGYAESKFMNDAWVYNSQKNSWNEIKIEENSSMPAQRSNCSFVYSQSYRGMIMFAGGSAENGKLNDLWLLRVEEDQKEKGFKGIWKQLYPQNCKVPWARTYHVSQHYQNYLIVHGGESYVGQVNDCWALDLNQLRWTEMHSAQKQNARKFHSSSILHSKLYIIGGIQSNNQLINKIQFTDISIFESHDSEKIEGHLFQWHSIELSQNQRSLVGRWGHVSKTFQNKIFIFGGRTSVEQNDLLSFDPQKHSIQKISCFKGPEPRRRPSAWIVGSNFIIDSGFNGKYLNDQWFIDLRFHSKPSPKDIIPHHTTKVNEKQRSDIHINTVDNKYIDLSSKLINSSFQSQDDMIRVLEQLGTMNYTQASKFCQILKSGVFKTKAMSEQEHEMQIFSDKRIPQPDEMIINEKMLKEFNVTFSQSEQLANKKKILYNLVEQNVVIDMQPLRVIKVSQSEFKRIINTVTKDCLCDSKIVMSRSSHKSHHHKDQAPKEIKCCKLPLMIRSEYFKNVIEQSQKRQKHQNQGHFSTQLIIEMNLHKKQMDLLKIIILYCYYGHVILPKSFTLNECFQLYKLSKKYSISQMEIICFQEIKNLLMSKEFQEWIWDNMNFSKQRKLFNPILNDFQNKLDCGQQFISSHQFDSLLSYCAKQSKIQIQKDHSQINKNKWFELFQYILKVFSELCVKKIVTDVKIAKCDEAVAKRRNIKAKIVSIRNLKEDKENNIIQKNFRNHYNTQLSLVKNSAQSLIDVEQKSATLIRIKELCMDQIAKPLIKNSLILSKIFNKQKKVVEQSSLDEDILKMIKASLSEERNQGEFRFRQMLSEIM